MLLSLSRKSHELLLDHRTIENLVMSAYSILKPVLEVLQKRYRQSLNLGKNEFFDSFVSPLNVACDICSSLLSNPQVSKHKQIDQISHMILCIVAEVDLKKISYCIENLGPLYQFLFNITRINHSAFQRLQRPLIRHLFGVWGLGFDITDIHIKHHMIESLTNIAMRTRLLAESEEDVVRMRESSSLNEDIDLGQEGKMLKEKLLTEVFDPNNMMSGTSIRLVYHLLQKGQLNFSHWYNKNGSLSFDNMMKLMRDTERNVKVSFGAFMQDFQKIKDPNRNFYT